MMSVSRRAFPAAGGAIAQLPCAQYGKPGAPRPATTHARRTEEYWYTGAIYGSHMPLDTEIHWRWDNPLNLLPASLLVLVVVALGALVA